jgi:hypothetical protein
MEFYETVLIDHIRHNTVPHGFVLSLEPKNGSCNHTLHSRIALVNAGCRQMNTVKTLKQGLVENQGLTLWVSNSFSALSAFIGS